MLPRRGVGRGEEQRRKNKIDLAFERKVTGNCGMGNEQRVDK